MPLTAIVTTSPTPTNPDVEFFAKMLSSLSSLNSCINHLIITFDGFKIIDEKQEALKKARITTSQSLNYLGYQENVKKLILKKFDFPTNVLEIKSSSGSRLGKHTYTNVDRIRIQHGDIICDFLYPQINMGFALSVREALKHVESDYVLIQQHDWSFVGDIPSEEIMRAMDEDPKINYVGFVSKKSIEYRQRICNGRNLPITDTFKVNDIPFTRLFYWYDKPHIARTSHYRDFVFCNGFFKRGDFIEDTLGHVQLDDVKQNGLQAHARYGTFLYYPDEGKKAALVHLNGRRFMTDAERETLVEILRKDKEDKQHVEEA